MTEPTKPQRLKILAVYGTRPEAIKMAPVIEALRSRPGSFALKICTTGQHREMLDQVQDLFGLVPDLDLRLMRHDQTLNGLASAALAAMDEVLEAERPDWLLVQGDTTTAMAAALAAFHRGVRVGHVEAGLRTRDLRRPFPEEANRRVIDLLAEALFAPTGRARRALLEEGCAPERIHVVGNTGIDALRAVSSRFCEDAGRPEVLVTIHRRESFGEPLRGILSALRRLAESFPAVLWTYPVHRNPNVRGPAYESLSDLPNLELCEPLDYRELVRRLVRCRFLLTDSGGIQEEAPTFGKPVLVLREVTERPEGVEAGVARLVGTDPERIFAEASRLLTSPAAYREMARAVNPYGDGLAAQRIAAILEGSPWIPFDSQREAQARAATPERDMERYGTWLETQEQSPDELAWLQVELVRLEEELERTVEEREAALATQRQVREQRDILLAERNDLERRLTAIERTVAHRFVSRFWAVMRRLFPEASRRRKLYRGARWLAAGILGGEAPVASPAQTETSASVRASFPTEALLTLDSPNPWGDLLRFEEQIRERGSPLVVAIVSATPLLESEGQRPTQLALALARRGLPVVFVFWRWWTTERCSQDRIEDGIVQIPVDVVTGRPEMLAHAFAGRSRVLLLEFPHPSFFELLAAANAEGWITAYDALDDWEAFHGVGQAIWYDEVFEQHVIAACDAVFAINEFLADRIRQLGGSAVEVVSNGLKPGLEVVRELRPLARGEVTVGYFGYLAGAWFDWELIASAAHRKPSWRFYLIGYGGSPERVHLPDNVTLLGRQPQGDLAAFAANWDVAVVPFKPERLAAAADPIKTYEYLAMGLAVVATGVHPPTGGERFVTRAEGVEEFVHAIAAAAAQGTAGSEDRRAFAASCTWEHRLDTLLASLERGHQRVPEKWALLGVGP